VIFFCWLGNENEAQNLNITKKHEFKDF